MASLLGKKAYKAIRVINSKENDSTVSSSSSPPLHSFFCSFVYSLDSVSIISFAENLSSFYFFEFSCWLSSTNNLTWIFVAFVAFIEVVSL